jgi:outer membrane protein
MLKIDASAQSANEIVYSLVGRVDADHLDELKGLLVQASESGLKVIFDLEGVDRVDRNAIRFFVRGPGRQAHLLHCPAYVKEWCRAEARHRSALRVVKSSGATAVALALGLSFATAHLSAQTSLSVQTSGTSSGSVASVSEPAVAAVRLSLREAIGRALSEGTTARLAVERVSQSRAQSDQARASLLPRIDGEVQDQNEILNLKTFGLTIPGFPSLVGPFNIFDAHVKIAARIIDVAAYRRYRAARQGFVVSEVERQQTENEVAAAVATLYVALQRAEASIDASRANVELSQKLFELAQDQRKAGVAPAIDSTRANVALARQQQLLLVAENRRDAARIALARAIGLDFAAGLVPTDPLREEPEPLLSLDDGLALARQRRPELRAASERLRQAELAVSADRAERLPSLAAQFQGGYNGNHLRDLDWNRVYGATLSIPIFTGGLLGSRIAEAESRRRETLIQERDTERQVEQDIRQALLNFESARSRVRVAQENERLARQELEYARDRFSNGVASSIEVDNAQASLTLAQDDRISALADEAQARFDMSRATGAIRDSIPDSGVVVDR